MVLDKSLTGLGKWAARGDWTGLLGYIFELHVADVCEGMEMNYDEVAEIIGDHDATLIWQCAFEDFLGRHFAPDARNIVDDYLKRRGWKESASSKRRMEALREAAMSLYLVAKVVPDQSLVLQDLIRGGAPILVSDAAATRELDTGDRIGARILALPDRKVLSAGWLPFGKEVAEDVVRQLKPEMKTVRREASKLVKEKKIDFGGQSSFVDSADVAFLKQAAPAFSMLWLSERIAKELEFDEKLPKILAEAGDDLALCRVHFPLRTGTKVAALRARLDGHVDFRADGADVWNWVGPAAADFEPAVGLGNLLQLEDGSLLLGILELFAAELKLTTMSRSAAERGKATIADIAGDLLEAATMTVETPEDHARGRGDREIQGELDLRFPRKPGSALQAAGGRRSSRRR